MAHEKGIHEISQGQNISAPSGTDIFLDKLLVQFPDNGYIILVFQARVQKLLDLTADLGHGLIVGAGDDVGVLKARDDVEQGQDSGVIGGKALAFISAEGGKSHLKDRGISFGSLAPDSGDAVEGVETFPRGFGVVRGDSLKILQNAAGHLAAGLSKGFLGVCHG